MFSLSSYTATAVLAPVYSSPMGTRKVSNHSLHGAQAPQKHNGSLSMPAEGIKASPLLAWLSGFARFYSNFVCAKCRGEGSDAQHDLRDHLGPVLVASHVRPEWLYTQPFKHIPGMQVLQKASSDQVAESLRIRS